MSDSFATPGSSVHGILQARILEWVATPSSRDLPNPGIKPESPASAGGFSTAEPPGSKLAGPVSFQAGSQCLRIEITASQTDNRLIGSENHPGPPNSPKALFYVIQISLISGTANFAEKCQRVETPNLLSIPL